LSVVCARIVPPAGLSTTIVPERGTRVAARPVWSRVPQWIAQFAVETSSWPAEMVRVPATSRRSASVHTPPLGLLAIVRWLKRWPRDSMVLPDAVPLSVTVRDPAANVPPRFFQLPPTVMSLPLQASAPLAMVRSPTAVTAEPRLNEPAVAGTPPR
jgi:hypothetical protein